jgi:hypothetical protein
MASIPQYVSSLRVRQRIVAQAYGINLEHSAFEIRIILAVMNATIAVVVKLLVDKALVSDAEVSAAFDAAMSAPLGQEPSEPPPLPDLAGPPDSTGGP